eukprot:TRINITY_DN12727_c0_g1_i1.p1 TRINITY_DN12727_c0_g1~~TRINITY_DN12727_c0_g1_i1.p1  ORF type:complete len:396 (+),score=54.63 TRINITY_DN12727_c0_g1_i1:39-1190(+)
MTMHERVVILLSVMATAVFGGMQPTTDPVELSLEYNDITSTALLSNGDIAYGGYVRSGSQYPCWQSVVSGRGTNATKQKWLEVAPNFFSETAPLVLALSDRFVLACSNRIPVLGDNTQPPQQANMTFALYTNEGVLIPGTNNEITTKAPPVFNTPFELFLTNNGTGFLILTTTINLYTISRYDNSARLIGTIETNLSATTCPFIMSTGELSGGDLAIYCTTSFNTPPSDNFTVVINSETGRSTIIRFPPADYGPSDAYSPNIIPKAEGGFFVAKQTILLEYSSTYSLLTVFKTPIQICRSSIGLLQDQVVIAGPTPTMAMYVYFYRAGNLSGGYDHWSIFDFPESSYLIAHPGNSTFTRLDSVGDSPFYPIVQQYLYAEDDQE